MIFRIKIISFLFIILLIIGSFITSETCQASEPLLIGILHSEKFPYAKMMKNSFEIALEVINKKGGIKGRYVKIVYADDRGERKAGEDAVKELVKKSGVIMLVGGYASSNTIYTAGLANRLNIPFLITTAADDRITQRKWKNIYRMNPPAKEYAKGLEEFFLNTIKPTSIAIIYENSPYGTGGGLRMMWFCRENDIEIRKIIPYHKEKTDSAYFRKLLRPLEEDPPDVIYMVSYLKDAVELVKQIRALKINSLLAGGAGGFTHQKFITRAGESAHNLLTATLWTHQLPYPGTREYYNLYLKKYSIPPDYHGAEAYSALFVVANVLKRAESFSPESIRAALDKTDIKTPFGPVNFTSYGKFERQNSLPTMVFQVIDGTFEVVWPKNIATSKFMRPPTWRVSEKK